MKQRFVYGQYTYEYLTEFALRKTLALEVLPDLRIIVKAPLDTSRNEIEEFLKRKWRWLEKQLRELRKLVKPNGVKQYVSGESFYYLGRQYMLLIEAAGDDHVKLSRGKLCVYTSKGLRNSDHNQKLLEAWYAKRRELIFKQEFSQALTRFNFTPTPLLGERIMARRWGSYTADGKVLLNPRLIEAPREAILYVCVHELCHKISQKHDELFYRELSNRVPHWRRIKESLEIRHG